MIRLLIKPRKESEPYEEARVKALDTTLGMMCSAHIVMPPPTNKPVSDEQGCYEVRVLGSSSLMAKAQIEHAGFRVVEETVL